MGKLSSPLMVCAVSREASQVQVQGAPKELLYERGWWEQDCILLLPPFSQGAETDRGAGICPMAAWIGGSPVGFAEGASFYMEMKNLG